MQSLPKLRLGDMLVTAGVLSEKDLAWALDEQKNAFKRLGEVLLEANLVSEEDIAEARALQLDMPYVDLEDGVISSSVAALIPEQVARTYNVLPLAVSADRLAVAMVNPSDVEAIDAVQRHAKKRVEPVLASETRLQKTLDQIYGAFDSADIKASIKQAIEDVEFTADDQSQDADIAEERRQSGQAPVVKTVNLILQEAVKQHASDIHLEPRANCLEIRYRVDGNLHQVRNLPKQLQPAVVSRIKIMSEMDIAETFNFTGIEYPGLIIIADRYWDTGNANLEITVAHEIAHQWWYSLVGNDQVGQPWLYESLTSYSEYVYVRTVYDDKRAKEMQDGDRDWYNFYRGQGAPDLALDLPVSSYADNNYGMIIYVKGPLFYAELEQLLGRERFLDALQLYFERHRYEIVQSVDVLNAFEDATGEDLDALFYRWVGDFPGLDPAVVEQAQQQNQQVQ